MWRTQVFEGHRSGQEANPEILGWNKEKTAQHLTRNAWKYWECLDGRRKVISGVKKAQGQGWVESGQWAHSSQGLNLAEYLCLCVVCEVRMGFHISSGWTSARGQWHSSCQAGFSWSTISGYLFLSMACDCSSLVTTATLRGLRT